MNKSIKGLAHLGIYTNDTETTKQFYTKYFGFEVLYETTINKKDSTLKITMLKLNDLILEILEPSNQVETNNRGTIDHFALEVKNIDALVGSLKKDGIKFLTEQINVIPNLFNGIKMIFLEGPNKERIELFEYLK